jgi:hypothetical protein
MYAMLTDDSTEARATTSAAWPRITEAGRQVLSPM